MKIDMVTSTVEETLAFGTGMTSQRELLFKNSGYFNF